MARFVDAIDLPISPEEAFEYLADFDRTVEWDPGVVETERLTPGPSRLESAFRVVVSFFGQRKALRYTITHYDRPHRLILEGSDAGIFSVDELTFAPREGGTRVTYEACLELRGLARFADPLLDVVFQAIGRKAGRGLRERFAAPAVEQREREVA